MWRGHSCLPRRDSSRRFYARPACHSAVNPGLDWDAIPWRLAASRTAPKSVDTSVDAADTSVRATLRAERFARGVDGSQDVLARMGGRHESGFKLRRRQVNAPLQHGPEESAE